MRRLLRLSLFTKILIANSTIVLLGALATGLIVGWHSGHPGAGAYYSLLVLFGAVLMALGVVANAVVLRTAFIPMHRLERVARRVRDGDLSARAVLGALSDPHTEHLAATFNDMLARLEARTREAEAASQRLQQLSDSVLVAQDAERLRLSQELHDQIGQQLSYLLLSLRLFRDVLDRSPSDLDGARAQTAALSEQVRDTLKAVRRLALELHPRLLQDLGLVVALKSCVEEWESRTGVRATFTSTLPDDVSLSVEAQVALYRMMQEALTNAAKHAHPTRVAVSLELESGNVVLRVHDDDPHTTGAPPALGLGLFSIQERIALAGGTFSLSAAPGAGTTATASIPLMLPGEKPDTQRPHSVSHPAQGPLHLQETV